MVKLSRHVFGSNQGYRTLAASDDLTPDELAELESFVFGQTNDAEYLMSLANNPAYWSRQLSSGRRAVTRVFLGPKDDQGRQSLCFVSAIVFAAEWISALNGEDAALIGVDKIWTWDGKTLLPRIEVQITKPTLVRPTVEQRGRILSLLGMIESMSDTPTTSIVLEERQLDSAEFAMVLALLPVWYRPQFSYGFRSLSEALPVQLNYLALCASRGKSRRKISRWTPNSGYATAKYAAGLAHFWSEGDAPPWEFVENCKAFGDLLPTWEGTDVPTGTIAPPEPTLKQKRRRQHRRVRIPKIAYWVIGMLLVVSATGFVTVRTIQSRRHADTTLAAAEAFLAEHFDSTQLPATGHERKKLIESAQSHADKVADLNDASRADRKTIVAAQLIGWLDAAGEQATKYSSLDEMLAGFSTFQKPLGLEQPGAMMRIPDAVSRLAVAGWKARFKNAETQAESLGEPYPARIAGAMDRFRQWNDRVKELLNQCQAGLAGIEKLLGSPLPTILSNDVMRFWNDVQSQFSNLDEILPDNQASNKDRSKATLIDEQLAELFEQRRIVELSVEEWRDRINKIQSEIDQFIVRARNLISQYELEFDPVQANELEEPWKGAAQARGAIRQALELWPDFDESLVLLNKVSTWMDNAADLAIVHFTRAFEHADFIWREEKKHVFKITNSNGVSDQPPNPEPAIKAVKDALDYWDANSDSIRHFDGRMADNRRRQATLLYSVLQRAKSEYDAAIARNTPTPTPTPKP